MTAHVPYPRFLGLVSSLEQALFSSLTRTLWRRRIARDPRSPQWLPSIAKSAEELRRTISELDVTAGGRDPETVAYWGRWRDRLRRRILEDDPAEFLTWEFMHSGMVCTRMDWGRVELAALHRSQAWDRVWREALVEDPIGMPQLFPLHLRSSGALIHHAFHLLMFERWNGVGVEHLDSILEFGGGYGSMRRLVARLGHRGRYHIHDLPEAVALQRFYLSAIEAVRPELHEALETTFSAEIGGLPPPGFWRGRSLFLATWSFSETPVALREHWLPILGSCSHFLIGYRASFDGIDNRRWFQDFAARRPDVEWHHVEIAHRQGEFYLIGAPKA
ncbi:MAG TPA: hypothetical protein VFS53_00725 [Gemmatimonadota bacterium]|nr:hypothetical protein [Gemmatimonadota bacterium]